MVSNDQTAYVPGRHIGESVRLISDLLEYTDSHNIPGFMITADIEKPSIRLSILLLQQLFKSLALVQACYSGLKPHHVSKKAV